jgi:hypothetical protein
MAQRDSHRQHAVVVTKVDLQVLHVQPSVVVHQGGNTVRFDDVDNHRAHNVVADSFYSSSFIKLFLIGKARLHTKTHTH